MGKDASIIAFSASLSTTKNLFLGQAPFLNIKGENFSKLPSLNMFLSF
ncbi:hypothetical protein BACSTE_01315 [Bacteroides stercoris ATCC 43183]|uniref:Uncharacterized protein n=1 Tax=Bacteroides stercoris ATCC 43183 TaxID=449673 RepID=B0NP68_BACSE|nr:hypothetical protein BACSTE_01315 [Bacteroides stercoris ATCC 43183]